jgi:hypothetical protein
MVPRRLTRLKADVRRQHLSQHRLLIHPAAKGQTKTDSSPSDTPIFFTHHRA